MMNIRATLLLSIISIAIESRARPSDTFPQKSFEILNQYNFNYDNFNNDRSAFMWKGVCRDGKRQSPIKLVKTFKSMKKGTSIRATGANKHMPKSVKVTNNGHGAVFSFIYDDTAVPQITGKALNDDIYNFIQFHMHWPCEHIPEIPICSMELHMVHFNSKYGNLENAIKADDGLVVIGIQYISIRNDIDRLPFIPLINKVLKTNATHIENKNVFSYHDILPFDELPKSFFYNGSLTTPNCGRIKFFYLMKIEKFNLFCLL
jgi:carbonic anhydrase